jgi:hypothetical protein
MHGNDMPPSSGRLLRGFSALLLIVGCTAPPLQKNEVASLVQELFPAREPDQFRASGEATFSIDGEVHACGIEVKAAADTFRTEFYGPLGISIGSISASVSSGRGFLRLRDKTHEFDLSQTVSIPSIGMNASLTYGDMIRALLGRVPPIYEDPLEKPADSTINDREAITSLWKTDSMEFRIRIKKRTAAISEFVSIYNDNEGRSLRMSSFKDGRASTIEVRESDGNYFSITYSKVKRY